MLDAARYGRSNGGLVRLDPAGRHNTDDARSELVSFASALLPRLSGISAMIHSVLSRARRADPPRLLARGAIRAGIVRHPGAARRERRLQERPSCDRDAIIWRRATPTRRRESSRKRPSNTATHSNRSLIWSKRTTSLAAPICRATIRRRRISRFVRAADLDPSHADAHVRAGTLLLVAGEYREARALAERALKSSPANVDAHILLGNALAGLKTRAARCADRAGDPARSHLRAGMDDARCGAVSRRDAGAGAPGLSEGRRPRSCFSRRAHRARQLPVGNRRHQGGRGDAPRDAWHGAAEPRRASRAGSALPHDAAGETGGTAFQALAADARGKLALADFYLGTKQDAAAQARARRAGGRRQQEPQPRRAVAPGVARVLRADRSRRRIASSTRS